MSYILEALKKSQQERELGHVPTLETPPFAVEEGDSRPSPWVLSAVILAALAVAIALYSALRGGPSAPEPAEMLVEESQSPPPAQEDQRAPEEPPEPAVAVASEPASPDLPQELDTRPVEEEEDWAEPDPFLVADEPVSPPPPPPVQPPRAAPKPRPAPARADRAPVPDDLIADIEAFKREVREEQAAKTRPAKAEKVLAPQELRLPKDVRERMPEFVMSAHIYDKEPAKRFVLINGLKTREGEESREEITVEEILPDGAVLRFEGNRFFQRR
jgi:general secretion pathway protein B